MFSCRSDNIPINVFLGEGYKGEVNHSWGIIVGI